MKQNSVFIKLLATVFVCFSFSFFHAQSADTNGVAAFRVGTKWGIIDHRGRMVCAPKYDGITFYKNLGQYYLDRKAGAIRADGKELTKPIYENINFGSYGLHAFLRDGKWGYFNDDGIEKIAPKYDDAGYFDEDRAIVKIGKNEYLIDREGREVSNLGGHAFLYSNDSILVTYDSTSALVDHDGNTIKNYPFHIFWISGNFMVIGNSYADDKNGLADMNGKLLLPVKYSSIAPDTDVILVTKEGLVGYLDKHNREIIPLGKYQLLDVFRGDNKYAEYTRGDKAGYVDRTGHEMGIEFEETKRFLSTVADAKQNGKWGCIDTSGKWILPCKYSDVSAVKANMFWVKKGKKWLLVDNNGKKYVRTKFDNYGINGGIPPTPFNRMIVVSDGKYGVMDMNGDFVVKPLYDEIKTYSWY